MRIGGVDGTLIRDRSILGRWTFTRAGSGDPVVLPGAAHVYFNDESKRNQAGFIWVGHNNAEDAQQVISDVAAMKALHEQSSDAPMWVIPYLPTTWEKGNSHRTSERMVVRRALAESYGKWFIPLDEYLRDNALTDLGKIATAEDLKVMAEGKIPVTLMEKDACI